MTNLILASGSASRRAMLEAAGIACTVDAPSVDEAGVKAALRAEGASAGDVAEALAELKAMRISRRTPGALVLGGDQMLDCDGEWFDKAETLEDARAVLQSLRGRTHRLVSAAVIVRDGQRVWHTVAEARLTMRAFSDAFLDDYLAAAGPGILGSVGCYHIEGLGVQLFDRVQGDTFTIRGLPLLPLLGFLRGWGVVTP
jgi:septum formation protein